MIRFSLAIATCRSSIISERYVFLGSKYLRNASPLFSTAINVKNQTLDSSSKIENVSEDKQRHTKEKNSISKKAINIHEAIDIIKKSAWAKFDETLEIAINTGLDPRKPNQSVKGMARLPSGTGKKIRICVIANAADVELALQAGADVAGGDDAIASIQSGDVSFNTIIATPDMMGAVGKIGKILGPRGLMPNPKMGTVTKDVAKAVRQAKAGAVQFKTEKRGVIQAGIGKVSFTKEALLDNVRSFMLALMEARPEGFKGKFLTTAYLSSTMGPGVPIDVTVIDPANPRFMLNMPPIVATPKLRKKK